MEIKPIIIYKVLGPQRVLCEHSQMGLSLSFVGIHGTNDFQGDLVFRLV